MIPDGLDAWDQRHSSRCFVTIANSTAWLAISGERPPIKPPTAKHYAAAGLPWFEYYDADAKALEGAEKLRGLKERDREKGRERHGATDRQRSRRDRTPHSAEGTHVGSGARNGRVMVSDTQKLAPGGHTPTPKVPPVTVGDTRILPPTGYWIFVCNRTLWDVEAWLRSGATEMLYTVSNTHKKEIQLRDIGVLRVNALRGTRHQEPRPEGVYAILEAIEKARERSDDDPLFYRAADPAAIKWRARLKMLVNLVDHPVPAQSLPMDVDFALDPKTATRRYHSALTGSVRDDLREERSSADQT